MLERDDAVTHDLAVGRHAFIHVAKGTVTVHGVALGPGDAASTSDPGALRLAGGPAGAEVLLFDLG